MSEVAVLVILDESGAVYDVVRCNAKSRAKTVEQGELWIVHSDTGRVLPYGYGRPDGRIQAHNDRWYSVRLTQIAAPAAAETPAAAQPATPIDSDAAVAATASDRATRLGNVLTALTATIAARRRDLPAGSYTTHLFEQGVSKIKKKTGEEAVELILAAADSEIVSEAADLIYHLLVLFAAQEIDFDRVLVELQRRHS